MALVPLLRTELSNIIMLFGATALFACFLPARQALRIDVISALRAE